MGAYDGGGKGAPIGLGSTDRSYDLNRSGVEEQIASMLDPIEDEAFYQDPDDERRVLTPDEIRATIQHEISDSIGHLGSDISEQRRKAQQYYKGKLFGNEVEGRSSVVLTEVMETIEWIMPALMRMFLGGHVIVRYKPVGPEDEEFAKQATDYVNHVFMETEDAFITIYEWFKTALLEKNGFLKIWYEEKSEPKKVTYNGLDEMQVAIVMDDPSVEILEQNEYEADYEQPGEVDPETGMPGNPTRPMLYDLVVRDRSPRGRIRVQGIPPEEVLISRRATKLDDNTPFSGVRTKRTVSDLIAMGYPAELIRNTPSDDSPEFAQERTERFEDENTYPTLMGERADWASREVWVTECYMRLDEDGDGYSELRQITVLGEDSMTVLDDEEINTIPLVSLTPIPMPYKFFGMSIADQVMDLQEIRSTLFRQMLDNLYLLNNSRYEVVEGAVEIDDLLVSRPGGIVRTQAPGMIKPLESKPFPPMAFAMLEHLKTIREERTGITRYNQGTDASSLNKTATGINMIMNAAQSRIELIARVFAETGMRQLFKKFLRIVIEEPLKERVIRLRGEWVDVDPTQWNEDMDVEIEVGLGVGQAQERIQNLMQMLGVQGQINEAGMGGLLVKPENVHATVKHLAEAMGFKHEGEFFSDPAGQEPPKPPPDPQLLAVQQKQEEAQVQAKIDTSKIQLDARIDGAQLDVKKMEIEMRERVEMARIEMEREVRVEVAELNALNRGQQKPNGDAREEH